MNKPIEISATGNYLINSESEENENPKLEQDAFLNAFVKYQFSICFLYLFNYVNILGFIKYQIVYKYILWYFCIQYEEFIHRILYKKNYYIFINFAALR